MGRKWHFLLIGCLLSIGNIMLGQKTFFQGVDSITQTYLGQKPQSGVAIAWVWDSASFIATYGYAHTAAQTRVEPYTIFPLGELSQVFTTAIMARMEQEGELAVTTSVAHYLPVGVNVPYYQAITCEPDRDYFSPFPDLEKESALAHIYCYAEQDSPVIPISLCHLASHRSGLPTYPKGVRRSLKQLTLPNAFPTQQLWESLDGAPLRFRPGHFYHPSPYGMAVLASAISVQRGYEFEEIFFQEIGDPLGLIDTRFSLLPSQQPLLAQGYTRKGKSVLPRYYHALAPAMGLNSSAEDMLSVLEVMMGVCGTEDPLYQAFSSCQTSQYSLQDKTQAETYVGYGWFIRPWNNTNFIRWQVGNPPGYASYIGWIEGLNVGVVILANREGEVQELGEQLLNWFEFYQQQKPNETTIRPFIGYRESQ